MVLATFSFLSYLGCDRDFLFENLDVLIIILPYLIANMLVRGGIERKYNKKARVWILEYSQAAWATILFLVLLIFF